MAKFSEIGLISETEGDKAADEYARYLARKTAAENFLYDAVSQVWNHGDDVIACRLRDLGVRHELDNCYGLIGVAHYDQITKICSEMGRPKPPRLRDDGPGLVFPFYDLPGRITGFLTLQYNDAYEAKQTYIPISGSRKRRPEAGYFMLQTTQLADQPRLKNTQFVFDDVLWVLKTQCKAFSRGLGWLPITASYTGPEAESYGTSWQSLGRADRIFYGTSPTPELISRACNARGYVSVVQNSRVSLFPKLATIRTKAQTWQQALKTTLTDVNEATAEAFAKRLTIPPDRLQGFLDKIENQFSGGFKDRVMLSVNAPADAPLKVQQRWFLVERESGWWNQCGRQVSNFRVVIDEIIHADSGTETYNGRIIFENTSYPFSSDAKKIERLGLLNYAHSVLATHGKVGVFDLVWNKKAQQIAMTMHQPKMTNVSTGYGWDEQANVFRFANYELTHSGEVRKTPPWPNHLKNKVFQEPTPIAPLPIRHLLTPAHDNSFVWATAAAVLTNMIAPIIRKDCVATAFVADEFSTATRVAEAMGCTHEKTTAFQKHVAGKFLDTATKNTAWPVICSGVFNDEVFGPSIPKYFNRPLLLCVTKQNSAVALGYGWQSISAARLGTPPDVGDLRAIVPAYVQRLLQMRMSIFGVAGNLNAIILEDLHGWLTETYGTAFNLPHVRSLMRYENDAHTALMTEINNAILAGKLAVLPQPRTGKQSGDYLLCKKDRWWLNRRAIDRYFYSSRCVSPNWLAVIGLLQKDGVYIGEEVIHNMPGVLVHASWFERFYTTPDSLHKEIG